MEDNEGSKNSCEKFISKNSEDSLPEKEACTHEQDQKNNSKCEIESMTETVRMSFIEYLEYLSRETRIREALRLKIAQIETLSPQCLFILQKIHQIKSEFELSLIFNEVYNILSKQVVPLMSELNEIFPPHEYYRYSQSSSFALQKLVFIIILANYLENDNLMNKESVSNKLGIPQNSKNGSFHLDLEDYLSGCIQLSNELSRWAVNSVTLGNVERPLKIANFLKELNNGFRLLNLKNDNLRKKMDGLKYDIKKVEEVVYDLSIRNLLISTP